MERDIFNIRIFLKKNGIFIDNKLESLDYDITMVLSGYIDENKKILITNIIKEIIKNNIINYKFDNITNKNLIIEEVKNYDRIHLRITLEKEKNTYF